MTRGKDWWTSTLFSVGRTQAFHIVPGLPRWDGYRVRISSRLDRDPGRIVYLELSVAQAKRLRDSLDVSIRDAEADNTMYRIQPDPLDETEAR